MRDQPWKLWAIVCLLKFALLGCGADVNENQLSLQNRHPLPLLVVMGGNTSCDVDGQSRGNSPYAMSLYRPMHDLLNHMEERMGVAPKFVISCYDDTPNVSYSMTSQADRIFRGDRHELDTVIEGEMDPDGPVFLAGHSYGGWLAMKSALVLAQKRHFSGLVTIDPISRVDCSYEFPFGCQQSPQDIRRSERNYINERSDLWINLYQDRTWYLHATPYAEADINEKIPASHTEIDTHERTWQLIREMVEAYY